MRLIDPFPLEVLWSQFSIHPDSRVQHPEGTQFLESVQQVTQLILILIIYRFLQLLGLVSPLLILYIDVLHFSSTNLWLGFALDDSLYPFWVGFPSPPKLP